MFESIVRDDEELPTLSSTYFCCCSISIGCWVTNICQFFSHHVIISICGEIKTNSRCAMNFFWKRLINGLFVEYCRFICYLYNTKKVLFECFHGFINVQRWIRLFCCRFEFFLVHTQFIWYHISFSWRGKFVNAVVRTVQWYVFQCLVKALTEINYRAIFYVDPEWNNQSIVSDFFFFTHVLVENITTFWFSL